MEAWRPSKPFLQEDVHLSQMSILLTRVSHLHQHVPTACPPTSNPPSFSGQVRLGTKGNTKQKKKILLLMNHWLILFEKQFRDFMVLFWLIQNGLDLRKGSPCYESAEGMRAELGWKGWRPWRDGGMWLLYFIAGHKACIKLAPC